MSAKTLFETAISPLLHVSIIFNAFFCFTLVLAIRKQKNANLPTTYIYNMSLSTIIVCFVGIFMIAIPYHMSDTDYTDYRNTFGPYITMLSTTSYIHPLFTLVLMTINRVAIVVSMRSSELFTSSKIWLYTLFHFMINLAFLLIPYFSPCRINFDLRIPTYVAACAPQRHFLTLFSNNYAVFLPFIAFFFNSLVIINFKLQRSPAFANFKKKMLKSAGASSVAQIPEDVLKSKKKSERTLMIQSFITSAYLSFYELAGFVLKIYGVPKIAFYLLD